jgi:hypothetical protein
LWSRAGFRVDEECRGSSKMLTYYKKLHNTAFLKTSFSHPCKTFKSHFSMHMWMGSEVGYMNIKNKPRSGNQQLSDKIMILYIITADGTVNPLR